MNWDSDRKEFRWLNGRSVPYPNHLKENMPIIYPNSWVADQVREKYGATGRYLCAEEDLLNIGLGNNLFMYILNLIIHLWNVTSIFYNLTVGLLDT